MTRDKAAAKGPSWLRWVIGIAVLAGLAVAIGTVTNGADVREAFSTFDYRFLALILALSTVYLGLKSYRFSILADRDDTARIMTGYVAGQAPTLIPGGIFIRAGILKRIGVRVRRSFIAILGSSLLDQALFALILIIGAVFVEPLRLPALIVACIALVLIAAASWSTSRRWLLDHVGGLADRFGWQRGIQDMAEGFAHLVQDRYRLALVSALTAIAFTVKISAFAAALAGTAASVPWFVLPVTFAGAEMAGRLSGLPAGVGATELTMIGLLVALSDVSEATALAATVMYRVGTVLYEAIVGALVYVTLWQAVLR